MRAVDEKDRHIGQVIYPVPKAGRFANRPYGMSGERVPGAIATEEEALQLLKLTPNPLLRG